MPLSYSISTAHRCDSDSSYGLPHRCLVPPAAARWPTTSRVCLGECPQPKTIPPPPAEKQRIPCFKLGPDGHTIVCDPCFRPACIFSVQKKLFPYTCRPKRGIWGGRKTCACLRRVSLCLTTCTVIFRKSLRVG